MNRPGQGHSLTTENILSSFPIALRGDPSSSALANVTARLLARRPEEIDSLLIYPAIDRLDEQLLDILAYDFKVDWWDADYTADEKRRTLKDSWRVHKLLGTKAAVEMAISAIYPRTTVLEWWEYGGEPYHFRLDINITNDSIDSAKQRRVLERLNYYKSLRSHNDGVTYFVEAQPAIAKAVPSVTGLEETVHIPLVLPVPIIKPTASTRVGVVTGLWESTATRMELPVPTIRSKATARVGIRTGLWEMFSSAIDIPTPMLRSPVTARATALAGLEEVFITGIVLPDVEPPVGNAKARVGVASGWLECYTTKAIPLMDKVLTAAAKAEAAGVVAAAQEIAKTFIDLRR